MSGIYIHIPFCKKKCHYCNFYSTPSDKYRSEIIAALQKELYLQKSYLHGDVNTIYFGGGTPSLLTMDEINRLLDTIYNNYEVNLAMEITLEVNPDDITAAKVKDLRTTGINRISIGIQSFHAADLNYLNRIHTAAQGEYAIKTLQDAGFTDLSIDLIYGIPTLSMSNWKQNLNKAIELEVAHISAYALTVEPKTNLEVLINKQKLMGVSETDTSNQFRYLMQFMKDNNYIQYEISNFCLPSHQSKHNTSYWEGVPYLGVGPSAHSYNQISRQWNCSNLAQYVESLSNNTVSFEIEQLSPMQKYNEFVMTSLRTNTGVNLMSLRHNFSGKYVDYFERILQKYSNSQLLTITPVSICLTDEGRLFADGISSDFFITD